MSDLRTVHEDHGATFETLGGREVVAEYRRPERTHRAVRNGVGVIDHPYGIITVEGEDRLKYVDNVVTNRVPAADGEGCYALLLDSGGRIEADMYVYNAGDRLLLLAPPGTAQSIVEGWEVFIQDVSLSVSTGAYATFGVHGPVATEKIGGVFTAGAPGERLTFDRGQIGDAGVTVVRTDAPIGEPGYDVLCAAEDAVGVFDSLVNHGPNAVPFGRRTWEALTLEAGTPLFETELEGRIPNMAGVRNAVDFEKGCFLGQEVVSRIENRGRPNERLVGLAPAAVPDPGAAVFSGDAAVGEVTRAVESPVQEAPIALASVEFDATADLTVRVDGEPVAAPVEPLPFVEGSERSERLPRYETTETADS